MFRLNLRSLYYDCKDLIKYHKGKLCLLILLSVLAIGLGVNSGINTIKADKIYVINNTNIILLINGNKSVFGFFLSRFIFLLVFSMIIICCSYRFFTTFLSSAVLFFFCYLNVRNITICLAALKLSFLPAALICIIPCILLYQAIFVFFVLFSMKKASEFGYYNNNDYFCCVTDVLKSCYIPVICVCAVCIAETILTFILTIGISV